MVPWFRGKEGEGMATASAVDNETAHYPKCGGADVRLRWQRFRNGALHIRADCRQCGFAGYVKQTMAAVQAADVTIELPSPQRELFA